MVSFRDSLLAFASWATFTIAACHFLLVQNSTWANGPSRSARRVILWCVSVCYFLILLVVVTWNRDARRLLGFEIPEPIVVFYGFVFNILLSLAFPEQTLLVMVMCSLLAYSLFSLIEIVEPTFSLGTLSLVLSVLSYKVFVTDTFWLWRVLFGLQCLLLPLWFWMVTRTGTEVLPKILTTGTGTAGDDGGGDQAIAVERSPAQIPPEIPERPPAPVPPEIQTTGRSTVDDNGGDQITVVEEEVPPEIQATGRRNVADEAGRPVEMPTNDGIVLPPQEGGSAETGVQMPTHGIILPPQEGSSVEKGVQTPEIGRQELQAIISDRRRDAVINVGIGVLRDVFEEMRDTIVGRIIIRDVMSMIGAEIERDVLAQDVRHEVERDVAAEDVRDVSAEDARDNANVAEVIFRDVRNIATQLLRDVVAHEDMRDAIRVAMAVSTDVYGLIIAEVVRDAIIAEAVIRYVMTYLSIQIPDDEGIVPSLQGGQIVEGIPLVDQGMDDAGGSDDKGTEGTVRPPREDHIVECKGTEGTVLPPQEDQIVEGKGTEGTVLPPQEDQTVEGKLLVDQELHNAGGSDGNGTEGMVLTPPRRPNC